MTLIVIVMGVSGAGKSTVGAALARALDAEFLDADEFHPPGNVAKMAAGTALTDADRRPWLDRLNRELRAREAERRSAVLACSALKAAYRERLLVGIKRPCVVYLRGDIEFIRTRLQARQHKYMPASLLESQFTALEPPQDALEIDTALGVEDAVARITAEIAKQDPERRP